MEVDLTPDQQAFVQQAVQNGRYPTAEDAVRDAMNRWEEGERSRAELIASIEAAEADLETGHYTDYTDEALPLLAAELKSEGRALRESRSRTGLRV